MTYQTQLIYQNKVRITVNNHLGIGNLPKLSKWNTETSKEKNNLQKNSAVDGDTSQLCQSKERMIDYFTLNMLVDFFTVQVEKSTAGQEKVFF